MISLQLTLPDKEIGALLDAVAARTANLKPGLQVIGETVRTSVERNFRSEGRPQKWEKSARAQEQSGQTLSDTARLRNSFTVEADKDSAAVGTNVIYAATQHFGARKGEFGTVVAGVRSHVRRLASGKTVKVSAHARRVTLPFGDIAARPFLMVQDEDWTEIRAQLVAYLAEK